MPSGDNVKTDNKNEKLENFHLLVMLIALIAVGQMTQTVYIACNNGYCAGFR